MAWVGFAESDERKTVRPVAHAGFEAGYLESIKVTWKDEPRGRGPGGLAIRTGKHVVGAISPTIPASIPARRRCKAGVEILHRLASEADGRTFGFIAMYAEVVDAFGPREIEVLMKLADDLAYGLIVVFRTGVQRESAAEALAESQRRLHLAERISRLAQWQRDLATDVLTWSDELYRILGLEPQVLRLPAVGALEVLEGQTARPSVIRQSLRMHDWRLLNQISRSSDRE